MKVTLLDEQGLELTEITSHVGRSPNRMLVDWATRPDALFEFYFDRGSRTVTAAIGAAKWSAMLGTRWQMGARFWFLHTFHAVPASPRDRLARSTRDSSGLAARRSSNSRPEAAIQPDLSSADARAPARRGVPG